MISGLRNKGAINEGAILKGKYLSDLKDITITAQKKLRIVKFPECVYNDCIVNLENNQLTFYGFKYKHINDRRYDDYITEQRIIGPELKCSAVGC